MTSTMEAVSLATRTASSKMAEDGLRAIKEIERVLFFSDLDLKTNNDDNDNDDSKTDEDTASIGLNAVEDLERVLSSNKVGNNRITCMGRPRGSTLNRATLNFKGGMKNNKGYSIDDNGAMSLRSDESKMEEEDAAAAAAAQAVGWTQLVDLLKQHFEATVDSGHKTIKEAERTFLFTDLPPGSPQRTALVNNNESNMMIQVQKMLQEMEKSLKYQLETIGDKSHKAYKECERTLLFTDLPR